MWAFLLAVVAVIGIGYGAAVTLEGMQRTADMAYVGSGARPDLDPRLKGEVAKSVKQ